MSCNGCRVLRKGCSESCILRPCLQWIDSAESQGHATVFVAKFFGRAGLMSFISNVPQSQRPALFQSLLFEACGRTVNPVNGAVGLLGTGNWHLCQAAVHTVLRGGTLRPLSQADFFKVDDLSSEEATCSDVWNGGVVKGHKAAADVDLRLCSSGERVKSEKRRRRPGTPSEESGTSFERGQNWNIETERLQAGEWELPRGEIKMLELFR